MSSRTTMFVLVMLAAVALLLNCADVPSTGPAPPDLRAQFRFIHAAKDLGAVEVKVDGVSQGSVSFQGSTSYKEFPAGSRNVTLSSGERVPFAMATNQRGTVVILPAASGAAHEFLGLSERRIFDSPQTAVRFVNLNSVYEVDVTMIAGTDTISATGLAFKEASSYKAAKRGTYAIRVTRVGGATVVASSTLDVSTSHTSTTLGDSTAVVANFADN